MPQFSYKARRRSGELVEGVLEVADRPAAVAQIERLGLFPIAVDSGKAAPVGDAKRAAKAFDIRSFMPPTLRAYFEQQRKPKLQEWRRSRSSSPICSRPECRCPSRSTA